jgi:signal transduction histidine kinase
VNLRAGLRERFSAVLAIVSVVTLAVAAVALFSPLDRLLRSNAQERLTQTVRSELGDFTHLDAEEVRRGNHELMVATRPLRRTGAEVAVLDRNGQELVATDPERTGRSAVVRAALRTGKPAQGLVDDSGGQSEAETAIPIRIDGVPAVVTARRPLDDVQAVTSVVRRAFVVASAAGLLVAVIVGVLLARSTARRIRRLRDTAERVAEVGTGAEFQPEAGRDEIGDLSRTFSSMQTRLREQEQARRAFVATASHELRTPVASLQIVLDLLISDLEAEPAAVSDALEQARAADDQAARLSQLAAELLDLSRIDAGLPLRREPVELEEVLRSVVAELDVRRAAERREMEITGKDHLAALADPGSVARILRILLDNALRHTPAAGSVRAEMMERDGQSGVAVQDDGPGVAAEERDRIFERFARGAHAPAGGFGLGLAIARELARRMGGDLVLADAAAGARFVLWLPRATPLPGA